MHARSTLDWSQSKIFLVVLCNDNNAGNIKCSNCTIIMI